LKACIIPVAAIEQHLEHLAMEHDWRSVCHIATLVAERLRPQVLVAEGLMAGISEHHMRHPARCHYGQEHFSRSCLST
jgi:creatinine amidohydrolase/Fe(II)-dependent formamide hydrolase-like protein